MVNTMSGSKIHQTTVVTGLVVTDMSGGNWIELPRSFAKWNHLSEIMNDFPLFIPDARVGVLIGSHCPKIEPKDLIVSEDGGPFGFRTFAGWTVVGSQFCPQDCINASCHNISVEEIVAGKPFDIIVYLKTK